MFPNLSLLSSGAIDLMAPELWRKVIQNSISDNMRSTVWAAPDWGEEAVRARARTLDDIFVRLCEVNTTYANMCTAPPSLWTEIVQVETQHMLHKIADLQKRQKDMPRFVPITDPLELFRRETDRDLTNIPPTLGRREAMPLLVLLFGAPNWMRQFMQMPVRVDEVDDNENDEEDASDWDETAQVVLPPFDDPELGPEGGGNSQ